jgi:hypothetical protein
MLRQLLLRAFLSALWAISVNSAIQDLALSKADQNLKTQSTPRTAAECAEIRFERFPPRASIMAAPRDT